MKDILRFITGFRQFQKDYFASDSSIFEKLKEAQNPRTMIIGCSDSRVDPALLTNSIPGEIFVVRNVANLIPPFESDGGHHGVSAALEFAVCCLGIEHIIVLGHSGCGGIKALMSGSYDSIGSGFISRWISMAAKARDRVLAELPDADAGSQQRATEHRSILNSIENLRTFPFVRKRLDTGDLFIFGWYFDMDTGDLLGYDAETDQFRQLSENHPDLSSESEMGVP